MCPLGCNQWVSDLRQRGTQLFSFPCLPGAWGPCRGLSRQKTEGQGRTSPIFSLFLEPEWHPLKRPFNQLPAERWPRPKRMEGLCVGHQDVVGRGWGRLAPGEQPGSAAPVLWEHLDSHFTSFFSSAIWGTVSPRVE